MPNNASAKKALRQSQKRKLVNKRNIDSIKAIRKDIKKDILDKNIKSAKKNLSAMYSQIDSAVKKKAIKAQTGSRVKSRVSSMIKKLEENK